MSCRRQIVSSATPGCCCRSRAGRHPTSSSLEHSFPGCLLTRMAWLAEQGGGALCYSLGASGKERSINQGHHTKPDHTCFSGSPKPAMKAPPFPVQNSEALLIVRVEKLFIQLNGRNKVKPPYSYVHMLGVVAYALEPGLPRETV